jgi:hypothetical protein
MKAFASLLLLVAVAAAQDAGILIGQLKTKQHGVRGKVFAVDEKTILVKNFQYDGAGPDAFFWVGTSKAPGNEGYILAHPFAGKFYKYDDDSAPILKGRFDGTEDIKLTLPEDLNVTDLKWFSVWCRQFSVNFGDLIFPENFSLEHTDTFSNTKLPPPLFSGNVHDPRRVDIWSADHDQDAQPEVEAEPDHHYDDHYNDEHERFQPRRKGASNLHQDAQPAMEATNGHDDHHNDEHERFQPRRNGASNVFSSSHTVVVLSAVLAELL